MGAQRVKSFEIGDTELDLVREYEETEGVQVPVHMIGELARKLAQETELRDVGRVAMTEVETQ